MTAGPRSVGTSSGTEAGVWAGGVRGRRRGDPEASGSFLKRPFAISRSVRSSSTTNWSAALFTPTEAIVSAFAARSRHERLVQ